MSREVHVQFWERVGVRFPRATHLPLYRQEKMSVRWGASISRKSMARWVEVVAEWLKPIYNRMREQLLAGDYLQADETPVRYHDPDIKKGKTEQGWLWAMSRPGGDVIFQWRLSRRHGEGVKLLGDYKGVLQSDGYEAYRAYAASRPDVTWVGCWAHARRRFREALQESPVAAGFILQLIGNLYHMERTWDERALTGARVRAARRQSDFPMTLKLLHKTLLVLRRRVLPRSGLGKACQYMLNHWEQLVRHCQHGQTRLDTNLMENAIRPTAIGKKNWMFIGHPQAGERSAIIYSIVGSCQRHNIDPLLYLRDVLTRLPTMSNQDDLASLCPGQWQTPRS